MKLTRVFKRVVAGGVTWTQDALPTDGTNFFAPEIVASSAPAITSNSLGDNYIALSPMNHVGWALHRLSVAYWSTVANPPYFGADLYAWDGANQQYYKTHDAQKTLRPGRVNHFDILAVAPDPTTTANLQTSLNEATSYILIVTPPPSGMSNGTYFFAMGGSLTSLGTEEPNPDDEANGVVAITTSDTANLPNGVARYIFSTDTTLTHTVKLAAADDTDANAITIPLSAFAGKIPIRTRKVFATGTTATGLFACY